MDPKTDPKEVGRRLRAAREAVGMTQLEVSRRLGISNRNISKYELGKQEADYQTLASFARLYGVSTDYLLGLTDDPQGEIPPLPKQDVDALDLALAELQRREGLSDEELAAFREYVITGLRLLRARRGQQQPPKG